MSRSDRHAVVIEYCADVVRMEVAEVKRHDAPSLAWIGRAVHDDALQLAEPGQGVVCNLDLVFTHVLHAKLIEIIDGRPERDNVRDVRRSGLKLPRQVVPCCAFEGYLADHFAAAQERLHLLEQLGTAVEHTNARGTEHLVRGEGVEITADGLHVHWQVRRALRTVHEEQCTVSPRLRSDLFNRVDRAERVGYVWHRGDTRPGIEQVLEPVERQRLRVRQLDVANGRALLRRQPLPGDEVRVVFHLREQNLVPLEYIRAPPRVGNEVDRLGCVAGEDDTLGRGRVDELRDLRAGLFVGGRRFFAEAVDSPVDVRVVVLVVVDERVDHLPRLLRCRRVVQIDKRLAIHLPLQDREVLPNAMNVQCHAANPA